MEEKKRSVIIKARREIQEEYLKDLEEQVRAFTSGETDYLFVPDVGDVYVGEGEELREVQLQEADAQWDQIMKNEDFLIRIQSQNYKTKMLSMMAIGISIITIALNIILRIQ